MKAFALLLQLLLSTIALAGFIKLSTEKKPIHPANLIHRDVHKRFASGGPVGKRAGTILSGLDNRKDQGGYFINITVGTPPQPLSVVLDTGSSDLWILSTETDLCRDARLQAQLNEDCYGGLYDPSKSSSYQRLIPGGFQIQYVDESESAGDYIAEDVGFEGGGIVKGLQMGFARNSTVGVGIMGTGYTENEAADIPYPNIIDQMVDQGLINTKAYSLYLDTQDSAYGSILFGGLDTKKFIGELKTLPLQARRSSSVNSFTVAMTGLSIGPADKLQSLTESNFAIAALLDSGTTLSYLPDALVKNLIELMAAYDDLEDNGSIWLDCSLVDNYPDYVLSYQFGGADGATINVPLREVIFDLPDESQGYFASLPWKRTCYLGILPSGSDTHYLLGDSFLRSAYVVYDIDNDELSIANTNFNAVEENIVEIVKGDTIPSATGVASQVTVTAADEAIGAVGGERTSALQSKSTILVTTTGLSGALITETVVTTSAAEDSKEDAGGRLEPLGGVWTLMAVWGAFTLMGGVAVLL